MEVSNRKVRNKENKEWGKYRIRKVRNKERKEDK